ncbi:MAG: hypothetical protein JW904_04440 [Spirochaetales bacterium]|nr:hypothetical protein [Spirochaetales bacterium]
MSNLAQLARIISSNDLLTQSQEDLDELKTSTQVYQIVEDQTKVYIQSLYKKNSLLFGIAKIGRDKFLFIAGKESFSVLYSGTVENLSGIFLQKVAYTFENAELLKKDFPFTAPISLREKQTTVGCGDRLGCCSVGHIHVAKRFDFYPVLAQQSIRELNFTKRTYKNVTSDVVFMVFQEGYEKGYGADGDHLKTMDDINTALDADMPMITLDLSEVMNPDAGNYPPEKIKEEFAKIDPKEQERIISTYADKTFVFGKSKIAVSMNEAKKCAVMYESALDFAKEVDTHLTNRRGTKYDLEISIDETTYPTLPEHHLFIIKELLYRGVTVNSLAPRFIGEFQKAIDYIGNINEFKQQFSTHCDIAKAHGDYKVSVHSGSDKFSVYPPIGKYTHLRLHLKTAGTSWLEAMRCISVCNAELYRKMHKKAFAYFPEASKFYHITADLTKIKEIDEVSDKDLPKFLEQDESRQLLHITYGGLVNDPEIREEFFNTLTDNEEKLIEILEKHFTKHVSLLGIPKLKK